MRDEKGESEAIASPQQLHPCGILNNLGTYGIKRGHPVLGGTGPDVNVAEDVHGSHQAIEQPPAAGLGHDIRLLGHQPEGHEQPVDTCEGKGLKGQSRSWGRLQRCSSTRSIPVTDSGTGHGEDDHKDLPATARTQKEYSLAKSTRAKTLVPSIPVLQSSRQRMAAAGGKR